MRTIRMQPYTLYSGFGSYTQSPHELNGIKEITMRSFALTLLKFLVRHIISSTLLYAGMCKLRCTRIL